MTAPHRSSERRAPAGGAEASYELQRGAHGWAEHTIYSFCAEHACSDGTFPAAPLIVDGNGNLFGTTAYGGAHHRGLGGGTAFELSSNNGSWSETVLHSFCAKRGCGDGAVPFGGLVIDGSGTLFGFTNDGGIVCADTDHGPCGVIYSIVPNGEASKYTVIHTFGEGGRADDGANPFGSPVLDEDGHLFGTTFFGGTGFFGGVAFELSGCKFGGAAHILRI